MVKLSDLAAAGALTGAELVPVVQAGTAKRATAKALSELVGRQAALAVFGSGTIEVNLQAATIVSAGSLAAGNAAAPIAIPAATAAMVMTNPSLQQTIYLNPANGALGSVEAAAAPSGCLAIGIVAAQRFYPLASFADRTVFRFINSAGKRVPINPDALGMVLDFGSIAISRQANTITASASSPYVASGRRQQQVTASQSVALPAATGTLYIWVDANGALGASETLPPGEGCIPFALLSPNGTCVGLCPYGNVTFTSAAGVTTTVLPIMASAIPVMGWGSIAATANWITANLATGRVATAAGNGYALSPAGFYRQITASQDVAITGFTNANNLFLVYVNMATGAIGAVQAGTTSSIPNGCLGIAVIYGQSLYPAVSYNPALSPFALVNSSGVTISVSTAKPPALVFHFGAWAINFQARTITTTGTCYIGTSDGTIVVAAGQSVAIPTQTGAGYLYATANGTLGYANNTAVPTGSYPIAALPVNPTLANQIQILAFGGNVTFTDASGNLSTINSPSGVKGFVQASTRLLLPDDLYFIAGKPQPLYRNSYLAEDDAILANAMTLLLDTGKDVDCPILGLGQATRIDPADLATGTVAKVVMTHPTSANHFEHAMTVHVAGAGALNGTSPKVLCIGDSLTQFGMIRAYQDQLIALGATPVFLGTFAATQNPSALGGNLAGEGRASWSFRSFTGRDSTAAGTGVTRLQAGATTQYQNPFLRAAVAGDLAANPAWCFGYTANTYKNPSYAENNALGSYYVFDFASYLANCGIATPDVVVIALGTNDLLWGTGTYATVAQRVAEAQTALEIMVRSIRAAGVPKVVIVPGRAPGKDATRLANWMTDYVPMIEGLQTKVRALIAAGVTGLSMVGTYAHTCRDHGYPLTGNADLSATSKEQVSPVSDPIHWTTDGTQTAGKKRVARTEVAAIGCAYVNV